MSDLKLDVLTSQSLHNLRQLSHEVTKQHSAFAGHWEWLPGKVALLPMLVLNNVKTESASDRHRDKYSCLCFRNLMAHDGPLLPEKECS